MDINAAGIRMWQQCRRFHRDGFRTREVIEQTGENDKLPRR